MMDSEGYNPFKEGERKAGRRWKGWLLGSQAAHAAQARESEIFWNVLGSPLYSQPGA